MTQSNASKEYIIPIILEQETSSTRKAVKSKNVIEIDADHHDNSKGGHEFVHFQQGRGFSGNSTLSTETKSRQSLKASEASTVQEISKDTTSRQETYSKTSLSASGTSPIRKEISQETTSKKEIPAMTYPKKSVQIAEMPALRASPFPGRKMPPPVLRSNSLNNVPSTGDYAKTQWESKIQTPFFIQGQSK